MLKQFFTKTTGRRTSEARRCHKSIFISTEGFEVKSKWKHLCNKQIDSIYQPSSRIACRNGAPQAPVERSQSRRNSNGILNFGRHLSAEKFPRCGSAWNPCSRIKSNSESRLCGWTIKIAGTERAGKSRVAIDVAIGSSRKKIRMDDGIAL